MMWILRKELRELLPVVTLVALALAAVGFGAAYDSHPGEIVLWAALAAGAALGAWHGWLDHRAEHDAFLRHRALSRTRIRVARTLGGLVALAIAVLAPWPGLLLAPSEHGTRIWGAASADAGDLHAWHLPLAFCFAAYPWALARLAGSVRRAWMRPVVAVLLGTIGFVALQSRDDGPSLALLVAVSAVATLAVLFPAREVRGDGAPRLLRPAALLTLALLGGAWLEAATWARTGLGNALARAFPAVHVTDDGAIRFVRSARVKRGEIRVRIWDESRDAPLADVVTNDADYATALPGPALNWAHVHVSRAERRLHATEIWGAAPRVRRTRGDTVLRAGRAERRVSHLVGADGGRPLPRAVRLQLREGRLVAQVVADPAERPVTWRDIGSLGPDGWTAGTPADGAPRFSDAAFVPPQWPQMLASTAGALETVVFGVVDPVARLALRAERQPAPGLDADAVPVSVRRIDLPAGAAVELADPADSVAVALGVTDRANALALRVRDGILLLDFAERRSALLPVAPDESLGAWRLVLDRGEPAFAVARPPYRDMDVRLRARVLPAGAAAPLVADTTLAPREPAERVLAGLLGSVTLARPPLLVALSWLRPAPRTWEELESRWWLDGTVAGGLGTPWLALSLCVAALCAWHAGRQALRRCTTRAEAVCWTVVALALGPLGLVWMGTLVRRSAVRTAPDGRRLAVHLAAEWPAPQPTGREVFVD